jgi:hypothetical protein
MPFNLSILNSYRNQGLRTFATLVKPKSPLPIEQFKILHRVTALHEAGKNAVYVTQHQPSGKTYFLKDISDSEKYHAPYRTAIESGHPLDGIYPDENEQKYLVEKEVFGTRLMNLFLGDNHTPRSIYAVIKNDNNKKSYLVASESVGKFSSLIDNDFYVKDGVTMIKIDNREYTTEGRLGIKLAQDALRERDGNAQNMGVVINNNGATHLFVTTIDHEHLFERPIDSPEVELQNLINANVFTPFGKKMDLHHEYIHRRDPIRLHTIRHFAHLLSDGRAIRQIFQNTFSHDHPPIFKKKIQGIVTQLQTMQGIYNQAAMLLEQKQSPSNKP